MSVQTECIFNSDNINELTSHLSQVLSTLKFTFNNSCLVFI